MKSSKMLKFLLSLVIIFTSIAIAFVWLKVQSAGPFRKNHNLVQIFATKMPKTTESDFLKFSTNRETLSTIKMKTDHNVVDNLSTKSSILTTKFSKGKLNQISENSKILYKIFMIETFCIFSYLK